jgi:hypothetical protein
MASNQMEVQSRLHVANQCFKEKVRGLYFTSFALYSCFTVLYWIDKNLCVDVKLPIRFCVCGCIYIFFEDECVISFLYIIWMLVLDGQELTIQKQPNTSLRDSDLVSPS